MRRRRLTKAMSFVQHGHRPLTLALHRRPDDHSIIAATPLSSTLALLCVRHLYSGHPDHPLSLFLFFLPRPHSLTEPSHPFAGEHQVPLCSIFRHPHTTSQPCFLLKAEMAAVLSSASASKLPASNKTVNPSKTGVKAAQPVRKVR